MASPTIVSSEETKVRSFPAEMRCLAPYRLISFLSFWAAPYGTSLCRAPQVLIYRFLLRKGLPFFLSHGCGGVPSPQGRARSDVINLASAAAPFPSFARCECSARVRDKDGRVSSYGAARSEYFHHPKGFAVPFFKNDSSVRSGILKIMAVLYGRFTAAACNAGGPTLLPSGAKLRDARREWNDSSGTVNRHPRKWSGLSASRQSVALKTDKAGAHLSELSVPSNICFILLKQ